MNEGIHKSVLAHSLTAGKTPERGKWKFGKDSHVYTHNSQRYVFKYSVEGKLASPESVQFLQKKYALLKHFLPDNIPQSVFLLGEYRPGVSLGDPTGETSIVTRAITIQRRKHGKTFAEMKSHEKGHPVVIAALREAHEKYMRAKQEVAAACLALGKPANTVDIKLDLGELSDQDSVEEQFVAEKCTSPNIIFDEKEKKVYFVDFGHGIWNQDSEEVFQRLMAEKQ